MGEGGKEAKKRKRGEEKKPPASAHINNYILWDDCKHERLSLLFTNNKKYVYH